MKKILFVAALPIVMGMGVVCYGQIFTMKKSFTGSHYGFRNFDPAGINRFVVDFNATWADDITTGFHQYDGSELNQTYTTSGFRLIWGKKDMKWTASSDYAFGAGKDKNNVVFNNGIEQNMILRATNHQISNTFGITLKEEKVWIEGMYCTNLGKVIVEYSTVHLDGNESFGNEYKLNGLYTGTIKTMEIGAQFCYKYKKYVFYARTMVPMAVVGPDKGLRGLYDPQSSQNDPKDFPSNYNTYVDDPSGHITRTEGLRTDGFKGFSYGFGMFYYIGKDK
jgi:hypothetical protein